MTALLLAVLLLSPARAETDAERRAAAAAALSRQGAVAPGAEDARGRADAAFTGTETVEGDDAVSAAGGPRRGRLRLARPAPGERERSEAPPQPAAGPAGGRLSTGLVLAGGAALGALQGFLSAGLIGAAAGGLLGLGAAWLYTKGHPAAAFGATAGGIIGTALGGPIGGLIGAVVGAGVGFLLGKLFGL